jgi:hypothetical protein
MEWTGGDTTIDVWVHVCWNWTWSQTQTLCHVDDGDTAAQIASACSF